MTLQLCLYRMAVYVTTMRHPYSHDRVEIIHFLNIKFEYAHLFCAANFFFAVRKTTKLTLIFTSRHKTRFIPPCKPDISCSRMFSEFGWRALHAYFESLQYLLNRCELSLGRLLPMHLQCPRDIRMVAPHVLYAVPPHVQCAIIVSSAIGVLEA